MSASEWRRMLAAGRAELQRNRRGGSDAIRDTQSTDGESIPGLVAQLATALQRLEECIGWRDDLQRFVLWDDSFAIVYGQNGDGALTDARAAIKAAGYSNSTGC